MTKELEITLDGVMEDEIVELTIKGQPLTIYGSFNRTPFTQNLMNLPQGTKASVYEFIMIENYQLHKINGEKEKHKTIMLNVSDILSCKISSNN